MAELVTDYQEHALPLRARLAARLHLMRCDACKHYFDQMRRTAELLRSAPSPAPAAGTEDVVLRRLRQPPS